MKLREVIQKRYKAETFDEIVERVSTSVARNSISRSFYSDLIGKKKFLPAGNTLLAGKDPIRPNCCILPPVTDNNFDEILKRSVDLWSDRVGIGFDLTPLKDPVKSLHILSKINKEIDLGHRPQRGNMAVLNKNHPIISDFITCKSVDTSLYNFNISVALCVDDLKDDAFMQLLAKNAWESGDPGIVFLDRIGRVPDQFGEGEKVDLSFLGKCTTLVPCGEQAMFPNEVCTLGSMNLACPDFWYFSNGSWYFNSEQFEKSVSLAVCFLDDVVDMLDLKDPILKSMSLNTRRIGLGVLGWHDVLQKLGLKYGSPESFKFLHHIGNVFKTSAHTSSTMLAKERGVCPALKRVGLFRRNISVTCIAPTGGISLLTENKGFSIEPFFEEAHNVVPFDHLKVQSTWQMYVDNCISKTINVKESDTVDNILEIFKEAGKQNVKSVTVYRDKSKKEQPISCSSGNC